LLKILVFSKADDEEVYGTIELMNRSGLPYELISDLSRLGRENEHHVIVIPESARITVEEERALFNSNLSILSVGYVPRQNICEEIGFKLVGRKIVQPPFSYSIIRMVDGSEAPFYYDFSIIEIVDNSLELTGKIYTNGEEYPGTIIRSPNENIKVFMFANLLRSVTYLFSGAEEPRLKSREFFDEYGRINARKIRGIRKKFFKMPIIEIYQEILFKIFKDICKRNNVLIVQKWFHPFNHKVSVCLTHDVDIVAYMPFRFVMESFIDKKKIKEGALRFFLALIYHASTFFFKAHLSERRDTYNLLPKQIVESFLPYNPYWNFILFDRIEKEFKADSSTYFFQTGLSRKDFEGLFNIVEIDYTVDSLFISRIMRKLRQKGYEIGLHGSISSYKDIKHMQAEKLKIANIIGTQRIGTRQHRLLMNVPGTWRLQSEVGFIYGATYGYAHDVGFRAGTGFPFNPWDVERKMKLPILEIPLIIHDGTFFQEQFLNYSADKALEVCRRFFDVIGKYNGVITLLWHPHVNRENQGYWIDTYREVLKYASQYNPWYTNAMGLAEWWNLRNKVEFRELEVNETSAKFSLHSPANYKGFSMKMLSPYKISDCKVFVNGQSLEGSQVEKYKDSVLFSFNMSKGVNEIEIIMNK